MEFCKQLQSKAPQLGNLPIRNPKHRRLIVTGRCITSKSNHSQDFSEESSPVHEKVWLMAQSKYAVE